MTIAIHRQPRFQRIMLAAGVVAVLTVSTLAVVQVTRDGDNGTDGSPTQPARVTETHQQVRLQSIQDGYLTPSAIRADQAAARAFLDLQDGYLPSSPAVSTNAREGAFLFVQDGYLPPAVWAARVEDLREDTFSPGRRGAQ